MAKKINIFNQDSYKKISAASLILFALYLSGEKEGKSDKGCGFEKLIKECFTLFPQAFRFSEYSQWPDSRKLDRPLRLLRKRKLIVGNPQTAFSLTKEGKKEAREIGKVFCQRKLFK